MLEACTSNYRCNHKIFLVRKNGPDPQTLHFTLMAVAVCLDPRLVVPLEQRPLRELVNKSTCHFCLFNCEESLEVHRRLVAGEVTLGEIVQGYDVTWDPPRLVYCLAKQGQLTLASELLKRIRTRPEDCPDLYYAALDYTFRIQHGAVLEMLQCLHERGFVPWSAQDLLSRAACRHSADVVQFIVEKLGADVNKLNMSECPYRNSRADQASPLFHAVYYLNADAVRYLLSVNADIGLRGPCSEPACIHEPLTVAQELQHFFSTREQPLNPAMEIDLWSHVTDKLTTVASILDMLSAALPQEEEPLA